MSRSLKAEALALQMCTDVACNLWLLVGTSVGHCGDNVGDALINEVVNDVINSSMLLDESRNIFQSVLVNSPVA